MTALVTAKVSDALQILQTLEIRHLPIVDERHQLVGMLSDRDIKDASVPYTAYGSSGVARELLARPVTDIMSSDVVSVGTEAEIDEIIDLLLENKVGALPVVDETTGDLEGIVSYVDVLRAMRDRER